MRRRSLCVQVAPVALLVALGTALLAGHSLLGRPVAAAGTRLTGIQKIQHVVIIMQENRSFDEYFGTYPGAAGIPMSNGTPTVCVPDPATGQCVKPYHDTSDDTTTNGGPHGTAGARGDI